MRKRKYFLSLVPTLETLCTRNPIGYQAEAFCRTTLVSLLLSPKCNIKNNTPKLKNPAAVNLAEFGFLAL